MTDTLTVSAPPYTHLRGRALALLAVLCGALFLDALDVSMLAVAIPRVGAELGMTTTLPWVIAGYVLGYGGFLLFGGRAADLLGRRRVFLIALAGFVLMSVWGGFAWNGEVLIATRFLKGIAAAFTAPAALSLVATSFREGPARTRAMSFYTATGSAGFTFGLIFGGLLTEWDWRAVFFGPAIVGAVLFVAGLLVIPAHPRSEQRGRRLDAPGAVLITLAMMGIVFGLTLGSDQGWSNVATWGPLLLSVIVLGVFVAVERRRPYPLLPAHVLTSWPRIRATLGVLVLVGSWNATQFLLTIHFQDTLQWSPVVTAAAFWPAGVLGLLVAPLMARLIKRFTLIGVMAFGLLLTVVAYVLLRFVSLDSMYWIAYFPAFALVGVAFTLIFSTGAIGATSGLPEDEQGVAGGVLQTAAQFGVAVMLAITTAVYRGHLPADASREQELTAYQAGWVVPLVASVLALIVVAVGARRMRSARDSS
ncbi:MFS transporter [Microbacterium sp. NPDC057407]|uniref:MFS transporter n=1 Tax=Microbacterium sp. NPDC057407 TaxID=3346120 RepID=UPI0036703CEC